VRLSSIVIPLTLKRNWFVLGSSYISFRDKSYLLRAIRSRSIGGTAGFRLIVDAIPIRSASPTKWLPPLVIPVSADTLALCTFVGAKIHSATQAVSS